MKTLLSEAPPELQARRNQRTTETVLILPGKEASEKLVGTRFRA